MTIRSVRDVQTLLSPIDPATGRVSAFDRPDAGTDDPLARILAVPREHRHRRTRLRRTVLVTAVLAVLIGAAATTIDAIRPDPSAGYAATPPLLEYEPVAVPLDAAALLRQLGDRAQRSTVKGSGDYEYVSTKSWSLKPAESSNHNWSIEPSAQQIWLRRTDNSGRTVVRHAGQPPADAGVDYGPGELPSFFCLQGYTIPKSACPGATDPQRIRQLFFASPGAAVAQDGVQSPLGVIAFAAESWVPAPAIRAELWRMLADRPGISYSGRVKDRAGRVGEAFSVMVDAGFGPARDTLIIDPDHGELLGYERTLQAVTNPRYFDAAAALPLKIRTPAVVKYTVFLAAELRPTTR